MRLIEFLCFFVVFSSRLFSQIPNAGFESWETDPDSNFNPVGWQTTNSFPIVNVEPFSPGCQGNYAMKVKSVDAGFFFPGIAILETAYNFDRNPEKFSACVKSNIMPGDQAFIIIALMKGDSVIASMDSCTFKIESTFSQFTYIEFPIAYQSDLLPDSLIMMVASGLLNGQAGTELIVDEMAFTFGSTNVSAAKNTPEVFLLNQNYPNPFNPKTVIGYQLRVNGSVTLKVYDLLGREVATLVNEYRLAGKYEVEFDAAMLTSGVYFYSLRAGSFFDTKKLFVLR